MGLHSRGVFIAGLISRTARLARSVNANAGAERLLLPSGHRNARTSPSHGKLRSYSKDAEALQMNEPESQTVEQELERETRPGKRVDDIQVLLRPAEVQAEENLSSDAKFNSELGFKISNYAEEGFLQHIDALILKELTSCGLGNFETVNRKEVSNDRNSDMNGEETTERVCKNKSRHFKMDFSESFKVDGPDTIGCDNLKNGLQRSPDKNNLIQAERYLRASKVDGLDIAGYDNVKEGMQNLRVDELDTVGYYDNVETGMQRCTAKEYSRELDMGFKVDGSGAVGYDIAGHAKQKSSEHFIRPEVDNLPLVGSTDACKMGRELGTMQESVRVETDGVSHSRRKVPNCLLEAEVVSVDVAEPSPTINSLSSESSVCQIGPVQTQEIHVPLVDPPPSYDPEMGSQYPVPLSPFSGETARNIEFERAMIAETAMKSGPAVTRSQILFEDEWMLVINKPCGIYSEHVLATVPFLLTPTVPLASVSYFSRLTLRSPLDNKDTPGPHLHMANRLDRDKSGVMIITKCRRAAAQLSNIFTKRLIQKSYIALCIAPRPLWRRVSVESGHGRSRFGAWRIYSKKDVGRGLPGGSVVREMTTNLVVLAINKEMVSHEPVQNLSDELREVENRVIAGDDSQCGILQQAPCSLVGGLSEEITEEGTPLGEGDEVMIRAIPLTGRTHQIRLHCQFVGLPLRGDVKYGGLHFQNGVKYDHHALHAESLSFKHPFTFEDLQFVAPLPRWAIDAGAQSLFS